VIVRNDFVLKSYLVDMSMISICICCLTSLTDDRLLVAEPYERSPSLISLSVNSSYKPCSMNNQRRIDFRIHIERVSDGAQNSTFS